MRKQAFEAKLQASAALTPSPPRTRLPDCTHDFALLPSERGAFVEGREVEESTAFEGSPDDLLRGASARGISKTRSGGWAPLEVKVEPTEFLACSRCLIGSDIV